MANRNRLFKELDFELPIIQAPMAGVQKSALAIAVCEAGGLGSLPCALLDETSLQQELETLNANTKRPYNVNFFCHVPPKEDPQREKTWRELLAPYYKELGLEMPDGPLRPQRAPFGQSFADIVEAFKPPVISFHFGLPPEEILARVRSWGARILSSATTLEEALWLESRGVDAIIAQGTEAGGHRGNFLSHDLSRQKGMQALVTEIRESTRLPLIAAGGIRTASDVVKSLNLGANAVQVGTAYLLCPESTTPPLHRDALKRSGPTALTNLLTGRPARGILNRLMRDLGPLREDLPNFPLPASLLAPLRSCAEAQGKSDFTNLWCGEGESRLREISAAALTRELAAGV
jgi:nitronate monooxygenase